MYKNYHHNLWTDRYAVHMAPETMDTYATDDSLFAGQTSDKHQAVAEALDTLPNARYKQLLMGLYCEQRTPKQLAKEMEISLPNFYNLHRRALAALKKNMAPDSL